jgi:Ca2+-binding EF-hand superfamily protein
MDTLLNGNESEKHEFSFALFDVHDSGYFGFEEFKEIITKFIAHFCIITGSHSKVDSESLKEIFDRMDTNKDGIVDVEDYKAALKGNPGLFQWFDLLNQQGQNDGKRAKKVMLEMKQKTANDILMIQ